MHTTQVVVIAVTDSGHWNSGHSNSGNSNSGYCNSGYCNSGYWNSGDSNSGDRNSGHRNSGHWNSGNWNSGHSNNGYFNTHTQPIFIFNKKTELKDLTFPNCFFFDLTEWITSDNMTKEEKEAHPEHETTGGYLKTLGYKEAWAEALKNISEEEKQQILDLPNYDPDIFEEITGVRIEK